MSDKPPKHQGPLLVPTGIAELHQQSTGGRFITTLSGMPALPRESVQNFQAAEQESVGFKFLAEFGPRAVRAYKLLEVARSRGARQPDDKADQAISELLRRLIGSDFVVLAGRAYDDCQGRTYDPRAVAYLDERASWRLTEFVHLFENVMAWGMRQGRLREDQASLVLNVLVRDFGAYYGLLVDELAGGRHDGVAAIVKFLHAFHQSPAFRAQLPVDKMKRLPIDAPLTVNLLDFEIARGIEAHPIAVRERIVRGDEQGKLAEDDPVSFTNHQLSVFYDRSLDEAGRAFVNAILPIFAISAFDGFANLQEVDAYLERRRGVIRQTERECFALLQCLQHYGGKVPPTMKQFRAADVMKAAQRVYRRREKEREPRNRAVTAGGMLKERLSGAVQSMTRPVAFSWPADRRVFQLAGYPDHIAFFPQQVTIRNPEGGADEHTFLCHVDRQRDPAMETPLMFEYQAVLEGSHFFDTHAALRDYFANAPDTFRRTLDAGPVALYAKKFLYADEADDEADVHEVRLLGTYVALNGGMKSWVGQHYLLSTRGANVFITHPDVRHYLSYVMPV